MGIADVVTLLGGIALFLFGMSLIDVYKRQVIYKLKSIREVKGGGRRRQG